MSQTDIKKKAKRTMGADKLHEKRLKERARRNGMAVSIEQMRLVVPILKSSVKVYSQAKVVAFALAHIEELQRENARLRADTGLPAVFPVNTKRKLTAKRERPAAPASPRPTKRARKETAMVTQTPTETSVASVDEDFVDVESLALATVKTLSAPAAPAVSTRHSVSAPMPAVPEIVISNPSATTASASTLLRDPLSDEMVVSSAFDNFDTPSLDWHIPDDYTGSLDSLPLLESFFE
eukprot:TRINITY_DN635_c1_g1_i1.p1 TRINITY_DN635_c1_g1~~TRINITY_DN635_c1_g1_i1.p1  ORF type:complete len:257 (+),score=84.97 TRINITY_DN635_c1_g1_i1:63-773(+)